MLDKFYGATLKISDAANAANRSDFSHFLFQVSGNGNVDGNGNYYLIGISVYASGASVGYQPLTLTPLLTYWSNQPGEASFVFLNMIMSGPTFFTQFDTSDVQSKEITINPTGLVKQPATNYYYLNYSASVIVLGLDHLPKPRTVPLNPSPPY